MTDLRYWDELEVGETWTTPSRTITETDVTMFAAMTGDFVPFHIDDVRARESMFGGRVAHGLLGLAYMQGMITWVDTGIASMGSLGWTVDFKGPIRIGDTLTTRFTIAGKRPTRDSGRGILTVNCELFTEDGTIVQVAEHRRMVRRRPTE